MCTKTSIRHLAGISLMHQVYIHWGFKNIRGQFHLANFLALQIKNIYFHGYLAPVSCAPIACALP